ncbi:MAG: SGNH/GDSL hydrolase family protein [Mobilicoccus sp.]|nr:SGNH/GDSL hydrolase family protein [Mobilicoccus sp.]
MSFLTPPEQGWRRYVAIGDSFTEGMSDVDPSDPNAFIGWADRLAAMLHDRAAAAGGGLEYANLAIRGRKLDDVVGRQLDAALSLQPDLVSMVGGGNDFLRPRADLDDLAQRLEDAVVRLRGAGVDVLLATPTDPRDAPLLSAVRGRHATHSANLWSIARRHGCALIDQWGLRALQDFRVWSEDRIHMNSEGHRRVALAAYTALGYTPDDADWETPLPPAPPLPRAERLRGDRAWARVYVVPWVGRRLTGRSSGDGREAKRPRPDVPRTNPAR